MTSILRVLGDDHRRCDALFSEAEEAVSMLDWARASERFRDFRQAMEHHFGMEEDVLFPSFEARTGMTQGPTVVMRVEHMEMRELMQQIGDHLLRQQAENCLGLCETLLILMQQHNTKEEQVLYRLLDQALEPEREAVIARMLAQGGTR